MANLTGPVWMTAAALDALKTELAGIGEPAEDDDAARARVVELRELIRNAEVGAKPDDGLVEPVHLDQFQSQCGQAFDHPMHACLIQLAPQQGRVTLHLAHEIRECMPAGSTKCAADPEHVGGVLHDVTPSDDGDRVVASQKADIKPGNAMPFSGMPIGTIVHNVELKPGKGGQLARSAGTYAQFVGRDGGYAQIRLSSGELRLVRQECMATIGAVSNPDHSNQNLGKAGRKRHMGVRPTVRGVAMNPIDHPHGGGEGRTSGGRHPVTPWGKPTKGKRTRSNKSTDKYILRSRHAKKGR